MRRSSVWILPRRVGGFLVTLLFGISLVSCALLPSRSGEQTGGGQQPPGLLARLVQLLPGGGNIPVQSGSEMRLVVPARGWSETGVIISPGDTVKFVYQGGQWSTLAGVNPYTDGNGLAGKKYPCAHLPEQNLGGVVGQVGESPVFWIGNGGVIENSPLGGSLRLSINDCPDSYHDNEGALTLLLVVTSTSGAVQILPTGTLTLTPTPTWTPAPTPTPTVEVEATRIIILPSPVPPRIAPPTPRPPTSTPVQPTREEKEKKEKREDPGPPNQNT